MKKSLFVVFLILVFKNSYSFQTSSESVNPFNQFMSPSGGVNMYSGDAVYSHTVCNVQGLGGLNIGVALNYSSNIYLNVRSRNDVAPTGWCGLGWRFSFGSITCNHKGTKTHDDDDFMWLSPAGVGSRILEKNGKYFIKEDPYTKIEPQDVNGDGVYDGWIVTSIDGKKMKYGNLNLTGDRKATRWMFSWGEYVGSGTSGTPVQYPYQWDLSEIEDVSGKRLKYYYQPELEYLVSGSWTSPVQYTKASYPFKVETQDGKRVEFVVESKGTEVYDPYVFQAEPDGFVEMLESMRLAKVKVFNIKGATNPVAVFQLSYTSINTSELGERYKKSLLEGIDHYNGDETEVLDKSRFIYNTDFSKGDNGNSAYDSDYNYGALREVLSSSGGRIEIVYEQKNIEKIKSKELLHAEKIKELQTSMTSDGQEYFVARCGNNSDIVVIYNWDGGKWEEKFNQNLSDAGEVDVNVIAAGDFITVRTGANDDLLKVLRWNIDTWDLVDFDNLSDCGDCNIDVYPGKDCFAVVTGEHSDLLSVYSWIGGQWIRTFPEEDIPAYEYGKNMSNCAECDIHIQMSAKHFSLLTGSNNDLLSIYTWNGTTQSWYRTFPDEPLPAYEFGKNMSDAGDAFVTIQMTPNDFSFRTGLDNNLFSVYKWNGTGWVRTFPNEPLPTYPFGKNLSDGGHDITTGFTGDMFSVITGGNDDLLSIYHWNGSSWDRPFPVETVPNQYPFGKNMSQPGHNGEINIHVNMRNGYFTMINGWNNDLISMYHWDRQNWFETYPCDPVNWPYGKNLSDGGDNNVDLFPSTNFVVTRTGSNDDIMGALIWDGKLWSEVTLGNLSNCGDCGVGVSTSSNLVGFRPDDGNEIKVYRKFQDVFSDNTPIYSYTVKSKKVFDEVANKTIVTSFEYDETGDNANYDTRAGTAKFNKVETNIPGNGKSVQYYFNDIETADGQGSVNADYDKLDGMVYRSAVYNEANAASETSPLSTSETQYSLYSDATWPAEVYQKRTVSTSSVNRGIPSGNDVLSYNNINGLPVINRTANSDGKLKLTKTYFAFQDPNYTTAMGVNGAYMLSVPSQTIVYEKAAGSTEIEPAFSEIRSAKVVTYSNQIGSGAWLTSEQYIWKSDYDATGDLVETFAHFDHTSGASNPNWFLTSKVEKYTPDGRVIESSKINANNEKLHAAQIYGYNGSKLIASVTNSTFFECGVFTGDYQCDIEPDAWWDKENGWEKGQVRAPTLVTSNTHFGHKVIQVVKDFAAGRNFLIEPGRAYTMSAWVKVTSGDGSIRMAADFRYLTEAGVGQWPLQWNIHLATTGVTIPAIPEATPVSASNCGEYWKLMTLDIPADLTSQLDPGYIWYCRAWIGDSPINPDNPTFTAYVDDIRFAPSDAMVASTYYDHTWQKPIISINARNYPEQKVVYDGFGRPVEWYKVDPKMGPDNSNYLSCKIQEKEYRLMGLGTKIPTQFAVLDNSGSVTFQWDCGSWTSSDQVSYTVSAGPWSGYPGAPFGGTISAVGSQEHVELTVATDGTNVGPYHWTLTVDRGAGGVEYYAGSFALP